MKIWNSLLLLSFGAFTGAAFTGAAFAQTAEGFNEGSRLTHDALTGTSMFSWFGREDHFYFIEHSENLVDWQWVPIMEEGFGEAIEWGFASNADRLFLRLRFSDSTDSDGDGLPDGWEMQWFGDLTSYSGSDSSPGDSSVTLVQAYLEGRNPFGSTVDGSSAVEEVDLLVYLPY